MVWLAFGALMVHDLFFDQTRFAILAVADVLLTFALVVGYVVVQGRRDRRSR